MNNLETKSDGFMITYGEVLTPTSLLDIIENFVLFTHSSDYVWSDEKKRSLKRKTSTVFPRYHQLDVLENLNLKFLMMERVQLFSTTYHWFRKIIFNRLVIIYVNESFQKQWTGQSI